MIKDSMTLYKLMILYMLSHVNFPISNSQISEFFLNQGYTDYSNLQQALAELISSGLIRVESTHNSSRYHISTEGEQTLEFFGKDIPSAITADIGNYLKENKFRMRNESSCSASYYQSEKNDYMVHCEVREGRDILIALDLSVPAKEQAQRMCDNWEKRNQEIYQFLMLRLMSSRE